MQYVTETIVHLKRDIFIKVDQIVTKITFFFFDTQALVRSLIPKGT